MNTDRIADFDRTLTITNQWLQDIEQEMSHSDQVDQADRHLAYQALRGVLFALRDCMYPESVHYWGAQLPLLVRGLLFEDYEGVGKPLPYNRRDFLDRVNQELRQGGGDDPEAATCAVLIVMARHMEAGAARKMRRLVPPDLRGLWPDRIVHWA